MKATFIRHPNYYPWPQIQLLGEGGRVTTRLGNKQWVAIEGKGEFLVGDEHLRFKEDQHETLSHSKKTKKV